MCIRDSVEVAVLLGAAHERDLFEPFLTGPRLSVEPLGHAAYGGSRPVPDRHARHRAPGDELAQGLNGVEEAVRAGPVQRDGGAPGGLADRDPVAARRQVAPAGGAQRPQRLVRPGAAEADDRATARQALVQGPHARLAQQRACLLHGVRVGVGGGGEGGLGAQLHGGPGGPHALRAGPDGRRRGLGAARPVAGVAAGLRGGRRSGRGDHDGTEESADHGGGDGRRPTSAPEPHVALPFVRIHCRSTFVGVPGGDAREGSEPTTRARGCQCAWPFCGFCQDWR